MFNQKRGLSDVVTVSLIILLAIAAVVIIWGFVKPQLTKIGEQLSSSSDCLLTDLKIKSCTGDGTTVVVENVAGDVTVDSIKLIYYDENKQNSEVRVPSGCTNIIPLQTSTCIVSNPPDYNGATTGNGINAVAVAAVEGKTTCSVSESVPCT